MRIWPLLLGLTCMVGLSVSVYAVTIPDTHVEQGVTIAETFNTRDLTETPRQFMLDWVASSRNALIYTNAMEWVFLIVPDSASLVFEKMPAGMSGAVRMKNVGSVRYAKFQTDSQDSSLFEVTTYGTLAAGAYTDCYCMIMGTYFDGTNYVFPNLGVDYLAEFDALELRDNSNVFAGGGEEETGFWGRIWEWLTSFWDTLKNLIISLFVPSEGYFDDWFEAIRSAWSAKVGALGTFMDYLKTSFSNTSGATGGIEIALPSGMLYEDSPGISVNLLDNLKPFFTYLRPILTGLVAILTVIQCYKRLVALTNS